MPSYFGVDVEDPFYLKCLQLDMRRAYAEKLLDMAHALLEKLSFHQNIQRPISLSVDILSAAEDNEDDGNIFLEGRFTIRVWNTDPPEERRRKFTRRITAVHEYVEIYEHHLRDEKAFFGLLFRKLTHLLHHELQEGFLVDGKPFSKPRHHNTGKVIHQVVYKFPEKGTNAHFLCVGNRALRNPKP